MDFLFSQLSGELQDALGVTAKSLPPFIYRMRQLGYPPGWLKEAEMEHSGLALYDGKGMYVLDLVTVAAVYQYLTMFVILWIYSVTLISIGNNYVFLFIDDNETEDEGYLQPKHVTYDVSKLINYPGFNISTPSGIPDVSGCLCFLNSLLSNAYCC